jgi:hypothetical protein
VRLSRELAGIAIIGLSLSILFCAAPLGACTALAPKNPVKASEVCGYAEDRTGGRIADLDLKLITEDQATVAEVHTNASGDFSFPPVKVGSYYLVSGSQGWSLGWPVQVTASRAHTDCTHPLIVDPSLVSCGGSISKKGYHAKF